MLEKCDSDLKLFSARYAILMTLQSLEEKYMKSEKETDINMLIMFDGYSINTMFTYIIGLFKMQ